jgi:hypothetical protein
MSIIQSSKLAGQASSTAGCERGAGAGRVTRAGVVTTRGRALGTAGGACIGRRAAGRATETRVRAGATAATDDFARRGKGACTAGWFGQGVASVQFGAVGRACQ